MKDPARARRQATTKRAGHSHFRRGTRLRVKLRTGEVFEDHFVDRTNRHVVLRARGRLAMEDVANLAILKGELRG